MHVTKTWQLGGMRHWKARAVFGSALVVIGGSILTTAQPAQGAAAAKALSAQCVDPLGDTTSANLDFRAGDVRPTSSGGLRLTWMFARQPKYKQGTLTEYEATFVIEDKRAVIRVYRGDAMPSVFTDDYPDAKAVLYISALKSWIVYGTEFALVEKGNSVSLTLTADKLSDLVDSKKRLVKPTDFFAVGRWNMNAANANGTRTIDSDGCSLSVTPRPNLKAPTWFSAIMSPPPEFEPLSVGSGAGTREKPFRIGSDIGVRTADESLWTVNVESVNRNATALLATADNYFKPTAGFVPVLVNIRTTYVTGEREKEQADTISFSLLDTSTNQEIVNDCNASTPKPSFKAGELFSGGSTTYDRCWMVPVSKVSSILLYVSPSSNAAYFATK